MYAIIGIIVLLVMVFGGFMLSGGALGPVMAAMPYEMLIIGGAAAGALVAGNSLDGLKALGTAMGKIFKGPKHDKQDHVDAIALTTQLMRMLKNDGPVALESHLEEGNQEIPEDLSELRYGVSVTDECIDWVTTESLILGLSEATAAALKARAA